MELTIRLSDSEILDIIEEVVRKRIIDPELEKTLVLDRSRLFTYSSPVLRFVPEEVLSEEQERTRKYREELESKKTTTEEESSGS